MSKTMTIDDMLDYIQFGSEIDKRVDYRQEIRQRAKINDDLIAALEAHKKFWDDMPKGQLGKIVCDIGILNDAFIKTDRALAKAKGE